MPVKPGDHDSRKRNGLERLAGSEGRVSQHTLRQAFDNATKLSDRTVGPTGIYAPLSHEFLEVVCCRSLIATEKRAAVQEIEDTIMLFAAANGGPSPNSLTSASSKRSCEHAIREFIEWYCSEPRLAFNRTVVTRYRIALEQHPYVASTINLRLAAIRRLAYEASDCGLLSPDLAAGIRRVKGVRRLGVRVGNWLAAEEGKKLLSTESRDNLRSCRNRALLALLIGCGLRRAEVTSCVSRIFNFGKVIG